MGSPARRDPERVEIMGYTLFRTGYACPEQWDVYKNERMVGYLRLRHGFFAAWYPDVGGEEIFQAQPKGDGVFEDDERMGFLKEAVEAIDVHERAQS